MVRAERVGCRLGQVSIGGVLSLLLAFSAAAQEESAPSVEATPGDSAAVFETGGADTQTSAWVPTSVLLFFENDGSFARPNGHTDRHYTSGQGFALAWRHEGQDALAEGLNLAAESTALGLTLVQQMYTPDQFANDPFDEDDRPYAGYLYLGGYWQRENNNVLDHVEIDLGVVGPSSGAEFNQEWVHDLFSEPDPDWSQQLGDEFTYNLTLRRKWRVDLDGVPPTDPAAADRWKWQLIPEVGLDVGNVYRRVHAGGTLRFGFNLPDDFGPARLIDPGSATGLPIRAAGPESTRWSGYVFVKALGRYVEWNTFIEGSNERNPSRAVSLEPWLGEFAGGFAIDYRFSERFAMNLAYTQTYFTHEFAEQDTDDGLGSFGLRFTCAF